MEEALRTLLMECVEAVCQVPVVGLALVLGLLLVVALSNLLDRKY